MNISTQHPLRSQRIKSHPMDVDSDLTTTLGLEKLRLRMELEHLRLTKPLKEDSTLGNQMLEKYIPFGNQYDEPPTNEDEIGYDALEKAYNAAFYVLPQEELETMKQASDICVDDTDSDDTIGKNGKNLFQFLSLDNENTNEQLHIDGITSAMKSMKLQTFLFEELKLFSSLVLGQIPNELYLTKEITANVITKIVNYQPEQSNLSGKDGNKYHFDYIPDITLAVRGTSIQLFRDHCRSKADINEDWKRSRPACDNEMISILPNGKENTAPTFSNPFVRDVLKDNDTDDWNNFVEITSSEVSPVKAMPNSSTQVEKGQLAFLYECGANSVIVADMNDDYSNERAQLVQYLSHTPTSGGVHLVVSPVFEIKNWLKLFSDLKNRSDHKLEVYPFWGKDEDLKLIHAYLEQQLVTLRNETFLIVLTTPEIFESEQATFQSKIWQLMLLDIPQTYTASQKQIENPLWLNFLQIQCRQRLLLCSASTFKIDARILLQFCIPTYFSNQYKMIAWETATFGQSTVHDITQLLVPFVYSAKGADAVDEFLKSVEAVTHSQCSRANDFFSTVSKQSQELFFPSFKPRDRFTDRKGLSRRTHDSVSRPQERDPQAWNRPSTSQFSATTSGMVAATIKRLPKPRPISPESSPVHMSTPPPKPKRGRSNRNGSRKRISRCGSCPGCLAEDCMECGHCKDMKKYGGPGLRKQSCKDRKCSNPRSWGMTNTKGSRLARMATPEVVLTASRSSSMTVTVKKNSKSKKEKNSDSNGIKAESRDSTNADTYDGDFGVSHLDNKSRLEPEDGSVGGRKRDHHQLSPDRTNSETNSPQIQNLATARAFYNHARSLQDGTTSGDDEYELRHLSLAQRCDIFLQPYLQYSCESCLGRFQSNKMLVVHEIVEHKSKNKSPIATWARHMLRWLLLHPRNQLPITLASLRNSSVEGDALGSNGNAPYSFAKLEGQGFQYYVMTSCIILGNLGQKFKSLYAQLGLPKSHQKGLSGGRVDVHLGSDAMIAQQHAKISWNFQLQCFQIQNLTNLSPVSINGAALDVSSPPITLASKDLIQIGACIFYFLLPINRRVIISEMEDNEMDVENLHLKATEQVKKRKILEYDVGLKQEFH